MFLNKLRKSFVYASSDKKDVFTEEYRTVYDEVAKFVEELDMPENVRTVMRLRYVKGMRFVDISRKLNVTYQWIYQLHKKGVKIFDKIR